MMGFSFNAKIFALPATPKFGLSPKTNEESSAPEPERPSEEDLAWVKKVVDGVEQELPTIQRESRIIKWIRQEDKEAYIRAISLLRRYYVEGQCLSKQEQNQLAGCLLQAVACIPTEKAACREHLLQAFKQIPALNHLYTALVGKPRPELPKNDGK